MRADLALVGFGYVGRRFARLIEERRDWLSLDYDREHAGRDVGDRDAEPEGRTVGRAGDAHQAALGLHHRVVTGLGPPGTRLPESRDGAVDDARMPHRDVGIAKPQPLHRPRPEVLDDNVRA